MIAKVITGGQTGADQAALRAATVCGIPTGGWVPKGWKTDDGPAPWLADYGCVEHWSVQYATRTIANVRQAETLIWFGDHRSPGGKATLNHCLCCLCPHTRIAFPLPDGHTELGVIEYLQRWVGDFPGAVLMVAGNRERTNPGIGAFVERVLTATFAK